MKLKQVKQTEIILHNAGYDNDKDMEMDAIDTKHLISCKYYTIGQAYRVYIEQVDNCHITVVLGGGYNVVIYISSKCFVILQYLTFPPRYKMQVGFK